MAPIEFQDISSSFIGCGCMHLGGSWDKTPLDEALVERANQLIDAALEQGIHLFDHADIYTLGKSEEVFGRVLKTRPGLRQRMYIQSKCGIRLAGDPSDNYPQRYDFSYEHIINSVEQSLKRLNTDYLDSFLLHRPDPLVEYEEVAQAFDALHSSGKVRFFGVSNHSAGQIALLKKYVDQPICVNQLELSLLHHQLISEGLTVNTHRNAVSGVSGTLDYCREQGIFIQAWSPLAGGRLFDAEWKKLADVVSKLADEKSCAPEAILIAWLLRHPANIQPMLGTTNADRLKRGAQAKKVVLSREEWYQLLIAARGEPLP